MSAIQNDRERLDAIARLEAIFAFLNGEAQIDRNDFSDLSTPQARYAWRQYVDEARDLVASISGAVAPVAVRKPVAYSGDRRNFMTVLCDDGTIWHWIEDPKEKRGWSRVIHPVPGTSAAVGEIK